MVWMLLVGSPPFYGGGPLLMKQIRNARADWNSRERSWRKISQDAKDFVRRLLMKESENRMDAEEALRHPWLLRFSTQSRFCLPHTIDLMSSMQLYASGCRLRRAALQMLVRQLDVDETRELRHAFGTIDRESKGWISMQDFANAVKDLLRDNKSTRGNTPDDCLAALDTKQNQRIYFSDFLAASVSGHLHERAVRAAFARMDADHSGAIGLHDLYGTLGEKFEEAPMADVFHEAQPGGSAMDLREFRQMLCGKQGVELQGVQGFFSASP
jgi:calcium-dependent protein kinase